MLDKLIEEGEAVRASSYSSSDMGGYLSGEEYEKWISKCILFLEKNYYGTTLTKKFIAASERAVGNGSSFYDTMMGILKALNEEEAD